MTEISATSIGSTRAGRYVRQPAGHSAFIPEPPRPLDDIRADILGLEEETEGLLDEIIGTPTL